MHNNVEMLRTASDEREPSDEAAAGTMRSPLEALHPDGWADRILACGSGPERAVAVTRGTSGDSPPDLVVLAPSRTERRNAGWARETGRVASTLAQDGLVVVTRPTRRLQAELSARGLESRDRLLHVPDVARSRYVFPVRGEAARYALRCLVPLRPVKRAAARALGVPGMPPLPPTSVIFRRPGARPLLEWMDAFGPTGATRAAIVQRSWRGTGSVVHRFTGDPAPAAIAKIGGGAQREAVGLRVAAGAGEGPVKVPALLGETRFGESPVVVETPVPGVPGTRLLRGSPDAASRLLRAVARWLAAWNQATASRRELGEADAERFVLEPARRLAARLDDGEGYVGRLRRLCERCLGVDVPFVDAHNDLTAANVLADGLDRPGIVDWENASADWLPLGDLAYAAADFLAAVDDYRDRPAAFAACFEGAGTHAALTRELLRDAAASHRIEPSVSELCLQACWLHHAVNEQRSEGGPSEEPFLGILRSVATGAIAWPP